MERYALLISCSLYRTMFRVIDRFQNTGHNFSDRVLKRSTSYGIESYRISFETNVPYLIRKIVCRIARTVNNLTVPVRTSPYKVKTYFFEHNK